MLARKPCTEYDPEPLPSISDPQTTSQTFIFMLFSYPFVVSQFTSSLDVSLASTYLHLLHVIQ